MKRTYIIFAFFAAFVFILASCNEHKPKSIQLKTEMDSLDYAFGLVNGAVLKEYHLDEDTTGTAFKSLMRGIKEGLSHDGDESDLAQVKELAQGIANQLITNPDFYDDEHLKMDFKVLAQGLINGINKYEEMMTNDEAREYFNTRLQQHKDEQSAVTHQASKEEGEAFLAENALRDVVEVTESGLQYEVVRLGTGKQPSAESKVKVDYEGTLIDGTVFDSSYERGTPNEFFLSQVVAGWTEGIQLMPVGSKFIFYIPQELGYGAMDQGVIKPFSVLIFTVELHEIIDY